MSLDSVRKKQESPYEASSVLSRVHYSWVHRLLLSGFRKPLEMCDVPRLPRQHQSQSLFEAFSAEWHKRTHSIQYVSGEIEDAPQHRLLSVLWKIFWRPFLAAAPVRLLSDVSHLSLPFLIAWLLIEVELYSRAGTAMAQCTVTGLSISGVVLLSSLFYSYALRYYFFKVNTLGLKVQSVLTSAIYTGVQRTKQNSQPSQRRQIDGRVVNFITSDVKRIGDVVALLHYSWSGVLQCTVTVGSLFSYLGVASTLAGVAFMVLAIAIQSHLLVKLRQHRSDMNLKTDERIKKTKEALFKQITCAEQIGCDPIVQARERELKSNKAIQVIKSCIFSINLFIPMLANVVSFILYHILYSETADTSPLTSIVVFPTIAAYSQLKNPFVIYPGLIIGIIDARISLGRIQHFLMLCGESTHEKAAFSRESATQGETKDPLGHSLPSPQGSPSRAGPACSKIEGDHPIEQKMSGPIRSSTFMSYVRASGGVCRFVLPAVGLLVMYQSVQVATDLLIHDWKSIQTTLPEYLRLFLNGGDSDARSTLLLLAYLGLGLALGVLSTVINVFFVYGGIRAARYTHEHAMAGIMDTPAPHMLGQAMNRLCKDLEIVDETLMESIRQTSYRFAHISGSLLAVVLVVVISHQSTALALCVFGCMAIIGLAYAALYLIFIRTARELNRMSYAARSPYYAHLLEAMQESTEDERRATQDSFELLDRLQAPLFYQIGINDWLSLRLQILGNIVLYVVIASSYFALLVRGHEDGALLIVGLLIHVFLGLTDAAWTFVMDFTQCQYNMSAYERLESYDYCP